MPKLTDHFAKMERVRRSLDGLSVGDAFGEQFFVNPAKVDALIAQRTMPAPPWHCTDDTVMALSIVDVLEKHGAIDQDHLASLFARRYRNDVRRGYGGTAHGILRDIGVGLDWRILASAAFDGSGSMGNGGAMRAAPIGAFAELDPEFAAAEAAKSAAVTHAHLEGKAGAIAVAVAASVVDSVDTTSDMFSAVLSLTPAGETHAGISKASRLPLDFDVRTAVSALGNGSRVLSQDTVPFALWCTAKCFNSYVEAMWVTVAGLGDRDTTCAIVGGILALRSAATPIPVDWLNAREPLDQLP
jgi:ADP-ribosylglycohydrolase